MRSPLLFAAFALAGFRMLGATPAIAEKRVALVIGNNAYPNLAPGQQLNNAIADARAVRDTLGGLGFEVLYGENLDRSLMVDRLFDLAARLGKDDVAFFFFAGHGVSLSGANYLLPSNIPAPRASGRAEEGRLAEQAVAEITVLQQITSTGARVAVVVLDACRNNPLQAGDLRSVGGSRGLARSTPPQGVFSIYSAGFGQQALDRLPGDVHPNSVFTRVFIEKLKTPGLDLKAVATQTRQDVFKMAEAIGHEQIPAYYDQIIGGDVYLAGLPGRKPDITPARKPEPAPMDADAAARRDFEFAERLNSKEVWEEFLRKYPTGLAAAAARSRLAALAPPKVAPAPEATPSARPPVATAPLPQELVKPRPLPASKYPTRPVTLVVPFAAGGAADVSARLVATKLPQFLEQPVIVLNKPGAAGRIAAEAVAKAPPDGYTLLLGDTSTLAISPSLSKNASYDAQRDFAPVGLVATAPFVLVVASSLPVRTVSDLTVLASKNPGLLYAHSGGLSHLAAEQLKLTTGIRVDPVEYRGMSQAVIDVIAGRVGMAFLPLSIVAPHVKEGKLRAIAVVGSRRASELPDVPTFIENGIKELESATIYGILAPKGTPADVIAKLNVALGNILLTDEVRTALQRMGLEAAPSTSERHGAAMRQEQAVWSQVVRQAGISAQ